WDRLATALGNAPQPAAPPLLASSSAADGPPPAPRATQLPATMPQGGAGAYRAERDRRPYVVGALRSPIGARRRASQLLLGPSYERAPGRQLTPSHQARAVRPVLEPKRHRAYTGY